MIKKLENTREADEALAQRMIGLAMKAHRTLGCGFIESVYANSLLIELRKAGIVFEREKVFPVIYDDVEVGVFQADLFVENRIIVELKSVEVLAVAHSVQLVITSLRPRSILGCFSTLARKISFFEPRPDFTEMKVLRLRAFKPEKFR
jgi:GxxExxY protein